MTSPQEQPTSSPLRCFTGSLISGGMGYALYNVMISIATKFANQPIHSDNEIVVRITVAVRTLIVGVFGMGMGIFGLVALGLFALGIQIGIQSFTKKESSGN
jgi:uncharacterized membrane protein YciS (DUF1049 family)